MAITRSHDNSDTITTPNRMPLQSLVTDTNVDASACGRDDDFNPSDTTDSDSDEDAEISNTELADSLPRRTDTGHSKKRKKRGENNKENSRGRKQKSRKKQKPNSTHPRSTESTQETISSNQVPGLNDAVSQNSPVSGPNPLPAKREKFTGIIFHFYEQVEPEEQDVTDKTSEEGTTYWRCYHPDSRGNFKTLTITKKMKKSQTGLIAHLRKLTHTPWVYQLWEVMKRRRSPPSEQELLVAQRKLPPSILPYSLAAERFVTSDGSGIVYAEPWNEAKFIELVAKWLAAADQPFTAVEIPEFRAMLQYAHQGRIFIPSADSMKRKVIDLADQTMESLASILKSIESKVGVSLDLWTSPNGYAFLAIVVHYITKEWKLEEILLDFKELTGQHSGVNIAKSVFETLEIHGLLGKVITLVMDNAQNNDTFASALEDLCNKKGIDFNSQFARMRCMPHTVHLSVLELLKAVGAVSSASETVNFQEEVTAIPSEDEQSTLVDSPDEPEPAVSDEEPATILTSAIEKLRKIVQTVRSSPQHRQQWLDLVSTTADEDLTGASKMLILDVKTRWSSTHQMLEHAYMYRQQINDYSTRVTELDDYQLTPTDWEAIRLVSDWLLYFREASTQMSTTKQVSLSQCHAIFQSLQDHLKSCLKSLPSSAPIAVKNGLVASHRKLSDYYSLFDESPFYIWATLLDPRIGPVSILPDAKEDPEYHKIILNAVDSLKEYYQDHYATSTDQGNTAIVSSHTRVEKGKINFLERYQRHSQSAVVSELEDFLRFSHCENINSDPLLWWRLHEARFPNVARMARDILGIPGSSVAVERISSGGRDTISLRRASLKPETIRKLMILKNQLVIARNHTSNM